jgi:PAS domain S-box-containing protein
VTAARVALIAALGAVAYGIVVALVIASDRDVSAGTVSVAAFAGIAFLVTGIIARLRRPQNRTGTLMLAVGFLWALGALQEADSDAVFTLGVLLGQLAFAPLAHLLLAFPSGELRERVDRRLVAATWLVVVCGPLAVVLGSERPITGCSDCPANVLAVTDDARIADAAQIAYALAGIALAVAILWRLARRYRAASTPLRRVLTPVYLSSALALTAIVVSNAAGSFSDAAGIAIGVVAVLCVGLVPVAFLVGLLRSRLARASVAAMVLELQHGRPLDEVLAETLGDPSLEIVYRLDEGGRWIDPAGNRVREPEPSHGRAVTRVERDGAPIAALVHDESLTEDSELVEAVAASAALFLHNERLRAEAQAQFEFLRAMTDTAPSLLVNLDTSGRIRNQNRAAVAAAGLDNQELVRGRFFWDVFIDPSEREAVIARFAAAAPEYPAAEFENAFVNARGERRVIVWSMAPVLAPDGSVMSIVGGGVDITERKQLEEEKDREREFLNAIANDAPSLLCLVDETGTVAHGATNKAFEATLEYEPDETGGHVFWERYIAPEEAQEVADAIRRACAGGDAGTSDNTWVTKSGRRLSIAWSCTRLPVIDERRLLLVSGVDVTVRKRRELELERERDATTTVLETISSVVVVLDRGFHIRDRDVDNPRAAINRAFRETLLWRDVDLVHRSFLELVAEDDDGRARRALDQAASGLPSALVESDWLRADGQRVTFEWSASPVADVTGRTDGLVLVSGVDITERKAKELEASLRDAFTNAIADSIPSFLVVVDGDAIVRKDGINRAFSEIFGWESADLVGRSFLGSVIDESDFPARIAIANAANGLVQGELESTWRRQDGTERVVAWSARPVTDVRGGSAVLVSGSDVTLRHAQAEELRASRARIVTAGDEARRRLERNLHDGAQQRLVALAVSLRLAESRLPHDPDAARPVLASAREELTHALEELRELARGIHPAVLTDRGLSAAVEALVSRAPVPVKVDVPPVSLGPAVEAAAYYVIAESLANVAKYAEAENVEVRVGTEDGVVTVLVADDGIGGADPAGGSGLRGLADRVAAMDGTISVQSPPGGGTRILAVIPIRETAPAA